MGIVSDAVAAFLVTSGQGALAATVWSDHLPPDPDTVTSVLESPGGPQPHTFGDLPPNPIMARIQILVRGDPGQYNEPFLRAWNAWKLLAGLSGQSTTTGTILLSCMASAVPVSVELDTRSRRLFSFDLEVCARWQ